MTPLFSVVIDNYNYGRFLGQAIESVLAQDFPKEEVQLIVVDDGSTDESREVLKRYEDRLTAILQSNRGQAGAFAAGFSAAKGEWICLLDSDDYWFPGKLAAVAKAARADAKAGIVQHYQRDVDVAGKPLPNALPPWPPRYELKDITVGNMQYAATSGLAFRRSLLEKVLPVPSDVFYLYDLYLIEHLLFLCEAVNVSEVLGCHRIHGANNWAEGYRSVPKMEGSIRELLAYRAHLEPKLAQRGLKLSPGYLAAQDMEILKRRVLIGMRRGDRGEAFAAWRRLLAEHGGSPYGLFRAATCSLALFSPDLYLRVYGLYSRGGALGRLRDAVIPAPGR